MIDAAVDAVVDAAVGVCVSGAGPLVSISAGSLSIDSGAAAAASPVAASGRAGGASRGVTDPIEPPAFRLRVAFFFPTSAAPAAAFGSFFAGAAREMPRRERGAGAEGLAEISASKRYTASPVTDQLVTHSNTERVLEPNIRLASRDTEISTKRKREERH